MSGAQEQPRATLLQKIGITVLGIAVFGVLVTGAWILDGKIAENDAVAQEVEGAAVPIAGVDDGAVVLNNPEQEAALEGAIADDVSMLTDEQRAAQPGAHDHTTHDHEGYGQTGGCVPGYGEGGQCLPVVPPSHQAHSMPGVDPTTLWTCEEVWTLFPDGIKVQDIGIPDPLQFDRDGDGVACGKGDSVIG